MRLGTEAGYEDLVFQFIPNVLCKVKIRALCWPFDLLHTTSSNQVSMELGFSLAGI